MNRGFSACDVIPFIQAQVKLSELAEKARAGAELVLPPSSRPGNTVEDICQVGLAAGFLERLEAMAAH